MLLALALNHAASSEPRNGNIAEDNAESALLAGVMRSLTPPPSTNPREETFP